MKWSGDRIPETNPLRLKQHADASYARAPGRPENYLDKDFQNPLKETEWWMAYTPSQEEIEAAAAGFDFSNPEKWLAEHGGKAPAAPTQEPVDFEVQAGFVFSGKLWPELAQKDEIKA